MAENLTERQNFLLGTIAAFIEGVILQPTLYWKNAKAQGLPFTLNPRLLYRGTGASIFNEMQMMGFQFAITKFYQDVFISRRVDKLDTKLTRNEEFLSATLSGVTVGVIVSPVELVMIQQQRFGGSFIQTPVNIVKNYGVLQKGLMRGFLGCAGRDAIYVCGMLGITPVLQDYFMTNYNCSEKAASLYASFLGGIFAAVPSHPFDVIKTCMQGDIKQETYTSFREVAKKIYREKRLFHGCFWRSVNVVSTVYIANECRNILSPHIQKINIG
jgi:hypothetical protein